MKCPFCGVEIETEQFHNTMQLHIIKCIANRFAPLLISYTPSNEQPKRHITELLQNIFRNVKRNVPNHPQDYYGDGNFPALVDAAEKSVEYITEHDNHYRGWLAFALVAVMDIVSYDYERFNPKKYFEKHKQQFKGLSLKDPLAKPKLYISYLATESIKLHSTEPTT
jgi:hypothetical protein